MLYRHKRKAILGEALQFTEDGKSDSLIASWFGIHPQRVKETNALTAHTLSGTSRRVERGHSERVVKSKDGAIITKQAATSGDWLIRTKSGGLYVCPEADFEDHYVKVGDFKKGKADAE